MGLALNFNVNNKNIVVPMCSEEASVIGMIIIIIMMMIM
jgi:hydroxymethylglutaryl-CoA reductase